MTVSRITLYVQHFINIHTALASTTRGIPSLLHELWRMAKLIRLYFHQALYSQPHEQVKSGKQTMYKAVIHSL